VLKASRVNCIICGKEIPTEIVEHAASSGLVAKYDTAKCRKKAKNRRYARNVTKRNP
jgi:hypothetical protein